VFARAIKPRAKQALAIEFRLTNSYVLKFHKNKLYALIINPAAQFVKETQSRPELEKLQTPLVPGGASW